MTPEFKIQEAITRYLDVVAMSRAAATVRTYTNALRFFAQILNEENLPPEETPVNALSEDQIIPLVQSLNAYAPATEQAYLQAAKGFFQFLAAERLAEINLPRLSLLLRQRARRPGVRLPQFPKEDIEKVINHVKYIAKLPADDEPERLRSLRDRAFLLTLADTGLRVHEACALRRGDVDWREGRAVIIGKGDKQAVIRFSSRTLDALRAYLDARAPLDGAQGRPLRALPLFARHDKGAGKKIEAITTTTGRNIVRERVRQALGEEAVGTITPHSFRHYFVTTVLQGSGGNLKLAQKLARHENIAVTQRYAHLSDDELDQAYYEIFEDGQRTTDD
ncbi:MAG: hypothetical protein Fur0018_17170 [Anaerolineales bacterium]